jgi:hypothetical protein
MMLIPQLGNTKWVVEAERALPTPLVSLKTIRMSDGVDT